MDYKTKIESHILDYVKSKGYKIANRGKTQAFLCPKCQDPFLTAVLIPNSYIANCNKCGTRLGNITEIIKLLESSKNDWSEEELLEYARDLFEPTLKSEKELKDTLDYYEKYSFDLVPVARNSKNPIESAWTTKNHKDRKEWEAWLEDKLNIGIKTGEVSNIVVLDFDTKEIPKEIDGLLVNTLYQKSNKGSHLFFKYTPELANSTRVDEWKLDILSNGRQVVVAPSVVDGVAREMSLNEVLEMPKELLTLIKSKIVVNTPLKSLSEKLSEDIQTENFNLEVIPEGSRNSFLLRLGGILRKEMNNTQVDYTLNIVNRHFCKPPLTQREVDNVVKSLDKYTNFDGTELAVRILQYLKIVETANSKDISEAIGEKGADAKQRIEKAIAYLVKEGYLIKSGRKYFLIKRAEWKEVIMDDTYKSIPFKVPYFDDVASFCWGDMILLGGRSKTGKTIISANFLKQFVQQGYKPHYIVLETGGRFKKRCLQLGLKDGDFKWDFQADPTKIELEKNSITIIDWLLIENKAETDLVMKHFVEQLYKTNGFLIIFMQLKMDGTWFAPNMIEQFPSLAARYVYTNPDDGTFGQWHVDVIREAKTKMKRCKIDCRYDWDTCELKLMDKEVKPTKTVRFEGDGL